MPGISIGDEIPDIHADSTHGPINLHEFCKNNWTLVFSHPADFTPVCTTELGSVAKYQPEIEKRGAKLLGLSCDTVEEHKAWTKDVEAYTTGACVKYPIMADPTREISRKLNMLDPDEKDSSGQPVASRALHIVGPDCRIRVSFMYPASVGRNFDEVIRVLDALQLSSKHKIACPVNWKPGDHVVISPSVSDEEAKKMFPQGYKTVDLPSGKKYMRLVKVD
ncbi:hypothetical protein SELMODRAFT_164163 [Selaginella moellendorffii]|uniref:Peroxiredoxin n=1 Tax=Selaginella moellendorffii TaxID=88036 RepID=D8QMW3_SELML|nr:1-Cys peroxiredoxin [Selaginella moellendorffii]XP_002967260.1 1-Cys peroxiredoxin [Selaginella moellendorffii]EFJ31859.1 hypothetical protein SELMODRAFT_439793 [Selaginella moellendorffii]EFJ38000.1 hypothetical protein SELMODRAFT_164163 [Selaginella moellendorffii]|eukprot:XP_002960461.1 1-Cys peroxiredoxin [Selaginella moellendorffii]